MFKKKSCEMQDFFFTPKTGFIERQEILFEHFILENFDILQKQRASINYSKD